MGDNDGITLTNTESGLYEQLLLRNLWEDE